MPKCENELGLHGADLENGLHDRRNGGLDGCMLNHPKKDCHANVGEHDLVWHVWWSRGGWWSFESHLEVGLKVQVCQR